MCLFGIRKICLQILVLVYTHKIGCIAFCYGCNNFIAFVVSLSVYFRCARGRIVCSQCACARPFRQSSGTIYREMADPEVTLPVSGPSTIHMTWWIFMHKRFGCECASGASLSVAKECYADAQHKS